VDSNVIAGSTTTSELRLFEMKQPSCPRRTSRSILSSGWSPRTTMRGRKTIRVMRIAVVPSGITASATSSYATTSTRARAAAARNDSSWHDDAATTSNASGLSSVGSPRNAGSAASSSVAWAGGAVAVWRRSYCS
jgi:hypothetical protein